MQIVRSMTHFLEGPWPAHAVWALRERGMFDVTRSVRYHYFFEFSLCLTPSILFWIAAPIESGCTSDSDCPTTQACRNRKCINPCTVENPCSKFATCLAQNHRPVCQCPPGMTGDPLVLCTQSKLCLGLSQVRDSKVSFTSTVKTGECKYDSECPDTEACLDRLCQNPCTNPFAPCGVHAECQAKAHRPVCQCAAGFVGNPHTECYQCR